MYVVGLSGGIGSGKTVASDHFATLNVSIVDTDLIAREIVEPGRPALDALQQAFGTDILLENGELDRSALREIAFSSKANKAMLDRITHPAIREETAAQIARCTGTYCIVVVPLLTADSEFISVMQRVLVVTANTELKIQRVMQRSQLSREQVSRIMSTQLSDDQRLKFADDVIENNLSLEHVYQNVERLHETYLKLASSKK